MTVIKLTINGDQRELEDGSTVAELLVQFKLDHKILVVELNQTIVDKKDYPATTLQDGDRLEIVHFVGGG